MRTETFYGEEYEVTREACPEYRSHYQGGMTCTNPDDWYAMYLKKDGVSYIAWYEVDPAYMDDEDPGMTLEYPSKYVDWDNPEIVEMLDPFEM